MAERFHQAVEGSSVSLCGLRSVSVVLNPDNVTCGNCRRIAAEKSGLPQSSLGGLHPELRARITNAKAALGDYEQGIHEDKLSWMAEADRLAAELRSLLAAIERLEK